MTNFEKNKISIYSDYIFENGNHIKFILESSYKLKLKMGKLITSTLFIQNSSTHLRSLNKVFAQFDLFKEFLIMGIFAYSKIKKSLSIKKKKLGPKSKFGYFSMFLFFMSNVSRWRVYDDYGLLGMNTKSPSLNMSRTLYLAFSRKCGVSAKKGTPFIYGFRQNYLGSTIFIPLKSYLITEYNFKKTSRQFFISKRYTYVVYFLKLLSHFVNYFFSIKEQFNVYIRSLENVNAIETNLDFLKFLYKLHLHFLKVLNLFRFVPCNLSKVFVLELEMVFFFQYFFLIVKLFYYKNLKDIFFILNKNPNYYLLEERLNLKNKYIKKISFLTYLKNKLELNLTPSYNKSFIYRRYFLLFFKNLINLDKILFESLSLDIKKDSNYLYAKHYLEVYKTFQIREAYTNIQRGFKRKLKVSNQRKRKYVFQNFQKNIKGKYALTPTLYFNSYFWF